MLHTVFMESEERFLAKARGRADRTAIMATTFEKSFNPMRYNFTWTADNWYAFDYAAAHAAAKAARDEEARALKAEGYAVKKRSRGNCLMSVGGIGSGHPQIDMIVTVYSFTATL